MLEKFMFRRVQFEVWTLVLAALVLIVSLVGFGALVRNRAIGSDLGGVFGDIAIGVATLPSVMKRVIQGDIDRHLVYGERFVDHPAGFVFYRDVATPGYVLLARYDGRSRESVVELYRETETLPLHAWSFDDVDRFDYSVENPSVQTEISSDSASRHVMHPLLEPSGDLVFHFYNTPLYKIDACSRVIWRNDDFTYHHSLERDSQGDYRVSATAIVPSDLPDVDESYRADYIVKVSRDGATLFSKSIRELLEENGLGNRVLNYDKYEVDPFHLNDVQPVPGDGPFWRAGDVFVSLAFQNMILLYRPSTDQIIWWTQDRIRHQHDVDVVDENRVAVFNNNRRYGAAGPYVEGSNKVLVYDLRDGSASELWGALFEELNVSTDTQGLFDLGEDGSMMVEETTQARIMKISSDGKLEWDYVNKTPSGDRFVLGWSRYLSDAEGRAAVDALSRASCD